MNWTVLKEKFPNSYPEIRKFSLNKRMSGDMIMKNFLFSKGYNTSVTWIWALRDYENSFDK